ncbi:MULTISPECIES: ArnT family glycosyltransferase [unclassified Tolypothrix]|uniref:ArnT family glycosyltransferase n=1 Tax=unclassified Tolypothrix TaxID=2649714 RepID=UPI001D13AE30|nr:MULTISPECIES: glycosyltransferase family 39 protein [unclassified Tolypothrix]
MIANVIFIKNKHNNMLLLLPIIFWLIIFSISIKYSESWRKSFMSTSIVWGVVLTFISEVLSQFHILNFLSILIAWSLLNCLALICQYLFLIKNAKPINLNTAISGKIKKYIKIAPAIKILLFGIFFVVATVGLIAIIAPPNNWDSMDYHMTRVVHWMQNNSFEHYPTSYTPQLYQNPWSEFVILHFQILSGTDYCANLVQWFSLLGCTIGVSLIAQQLSADLRGQVFAAVISATIPMGILQASSTQNDYVLSFWLVCLAFYVLLSVKERARTSWTNLCLIGSSVGLAILTKGTAYFYVLPFLIWLGISEIKYLRFKVWQSGLLVGSLALSLNFAHYLRNYNLFGSPLGEPSTYKNEIFGINILFSNILRNLALHIGTPIGLWNGIANKLIQIIHIFLGVDVNDPRITFSKTFFVPGGWSTLGVPGNENSAGNLLHLCIILLCIVIYIAKKRYKKSDYILSYLLSAISTFLLFCYLVKWQAWNSRLHLPFFVLLAPFLGVILSQIKKPKMALSLVIILLISSFPWLFFNKYRPIIDSHNIFQTNRIEQYFSNRPYLQEPYVGAVNLLKSKDCSNIGLSLGNDPWEYPYWEIWRQTKKETVTMQHVNVTNISAKLSNQYPYKDFIPCAIITMETKRSKQEKSQEMTVNDATYIRAGDFPPVGVFLPK